MEEQVIENKTGIENLLDGMKIKGWVAYRSNYLAKEGNFPELNYRLLWMANSVDQIKNTNEKIMGDGFVRNTLDQVGWVSEAYPKDARVKPMPMETSKNELTFAYPKNLPLEIEVPSLDRTTKMPAVLSSVWFKKKTEDNGYPVFVNVDTENLQTCKNNPFIPELKELLEKNSLAYRIDID